MICDLWPQELIKKHKRRREGMVIGSPQDIANLLDPRSITSFRWDTAVAMLLVFTIFSMPLSMAFDEVGYRARWLFATESQYEGM